MRIVDKFKEGKTVISFEIFPPRKGADINTIYKTVEALANLEPDFISVTYGAGGTGGNGTVEIAAKIKADYSIEALPHLTCITASEETVKKSLNYLQSKGIENILALRGDYPPGYLPTEGCKYKNSIDLIKEITDKNFFSIGAAAYPEGHIECVDEKKDIQYLKEKVDAGVDFLISQLFFDNDIFYRFRDAIKDKDINCKLSAGIMPILSKKQIEKMIFMCGATLPSKVIRFLVKYENNPEALRRIGIEYAAEQAVDLIEKGVDGVHIYTMNQPEIAKEILGRMSKLSCKVC